MKVYASLFGNRRSVDCEAMCFARAPATMVEVLAAQCQSSTTGDDVWWGQILSRRGDLYTKRHSQDSLVRFGEEVEMGGDVQRAET